MNSIPLANASERVLYIFDEKNTSVKIDSSFIKNKTMAKALLCPDSIYTVSRDSLLADQIIRLKKYGNKYQKYFLKNYYYQ